jgi:UPF0755 protein
MVKALARGFAAVLIGAVLLAGLAAAWAVGQYQRHQNELLDIPSAGIDITIANGTSFTRMAERLESAGLIQHAWLWVLDARRRGLSSRIKAGEYRLTQGVTAEGVLQQWVSGEVLTYSVTVPEGFSFAQMRQVFNQNALLKHETTDWTNERLMTELGMPDQHPEGRFMPNTYRFSRNTSDLVLYRQSMRLLKEALDDAWQGRDDDLPYTNPYEALIMASIIEKETGVASERREVAGVFVRRLRKRMRLQTDPTIIYGLGDRYKGDIKRVHLREATPYNTYVINGLPPTPIALPGKASIEAAVHPAEGSTLYFVADGKGGHTFSDTLKQHQAAVRRYLNR